MIIIWWIVQPLAYSKCTRQYMYCKCLYVEGTLTWWNEAALLVHSNWCYKLKKLHCRKKTHFSKRALFYWNDLIWATKRVWKHQCSNIGPVVQLVNLQSKLQITNYRWVTAMTALTLPRDIFPPFNFDIHELSSFYSLYPSALCVCFCRCCFLPGPSYTWDPLQFSYGCSTSLIIAEGAVRRQNRHISRVAECGEDNVVKREKSRLPTMTEQPPLRLDMTDICSRDQADICSN